MKRWPAGRWPTRCICTSGDTFCPVCGVHAGDPVHVNDHIRFVGIMAPTGTPHDRAIYIPLKTFYTLEGHGAAVAAMATDLIDAGNQRRLPEDPAHPRRRAASGHPGSEIQHQPVHRGAVGDPQ